MKPATEQSKNTSSQQTEKNKQISKVILITAIIFGILLRLLLSYNAMLEYDEIWTIQHYSNRSIWQILNDLAVPNNHPLNSIAVKLTYILFHPEYNTIVFRISSLFSGILLIFAAFLFCRIYARRYPVLPTNLLFAFTLFPLLFSPGLVHYSAILRGYAMQSLFVFVMYASLLLLLTETKLSRKEKDLLSVLCIISALLTVFSITSGAIFCFAATVAFFLTQCRNINSIQTFYKCYRKLVNGGMITGVIAVIWLGSHLNDIRNAQTFGNSVLSLKLFLQFIRTTLTGTGIFPFLVLFISLDIFLRKKNRSSSTLKKIANYHYLFLATVLLTALFSGSGPVRVYLPLCVPTFFTTALFLAYVMRNQTLKLTDLISLSVLICSIAWYQYEIPNEIPRNICNIFMKDAGQLPDSTTVIYPTGSGYEIQFNLSPESIHKETRRHFQKETDTIAILKGHKLTALDNNQGESVISISSNPQKTDQIFDYYALAPITEGTELAGKTLFAKVQPVSREKMREINVKLKDAGFMLLNPFLDSSFSTREDPVPGAFYATDSYPYTLQDLLNFIEDYAPFVHFYFLH